MLAFIKIKRQEFEAIEIVLKKKEFQAKKSGACKRTEKEMYHDGKKNNDTQGIKTWSLQRK